MSPEAYDLHDGRFLQERYVVSGADALQTSIGPVPTGKVWTLLCGAYAPSVAETKTVLIGIGTSSAFFPIQIPQTIALGPAIFLPVLTDGMEIKLFPADVLQVFRDSATLGSSISLRARLIETDLPYYSYEEPLRKVVKQSQRHGSVYRSTGGVSEGGAGGGRGVVEPGERGGRGAEPV